jgi:predicted lipoprotein with Yx(FWY)xxD motif
MGRIGKGKVGLLVAAAFIVAVLAALYAGGSDGAYGATGAARAKVAVVSSARNAKLEKTILVNRKRMTLYSLSAEKRGRFICTTRFCLSLWTPLVVPAKATPTGARLLDTIRRPDGRTQVRYRGLPLYTFNEDRKPGDVKGNGFRDVGIWLAASPSAPAKAAPAQPPAYGGLYG